MKMITPNQNNKSRVIDLEIRADASQLQNLSATIASLETQHRAGITVVRTLLLLQALYPLKSVPLMLDENRTLREEDEELLDATWGGLPHPDFSDSILWNLGPENIALEIPTLGDLDALLTTLSSTHLGVTIYCRYYLLDAKTGEKVFDAPLEVSRARYTKGICEMKEASR